MPQENCIEVTADTAHGHGRSVYLCLIVGHLIFDGWLAIVLYVQTPKKLISFSCI